MFAKLLFKKIIEDRSLNQKQTPMGVINTVLNNNCALNIIRTLCEMLLTRFPMIAAIN